MKQLLHNDDLYHDLMYLYFSLEAETQISFSEISKKCGISEKIWRGLIKEGVITRKGTKKPLYQWIGAEPTEQLLINTYKCKPTFAVIAPLEYPEKTKEKQTKKRNMDGLLKYATDELIDELIRRGITSFSINN